MNREDQLFFKVLVSVITLVLFCGFSLLITCGTLYNYYNVWQQKKEGEAELARAESNRQIKTLEAKAHLESSKYLAEAEAIRAAGVAESNKIIGDSLRENEAYLRYLWIQGLQTNQMQTVYVPTEAGLPILEANRMK